MKNAVKVTKRDVIDRLGAEIPHLLPWEVS